ncbi:hypothetical protein GWI33_009243 [Rhynchophorus ferrugineus]|uniref:Uncharacterized protein n=1 Tax=Rhynchophorus ferrugineus TaxID=354439 RepID=A0A834IPT9_RHYFE|nr:hypothetical protein GWI33_009243 [Rhynchophorus ferrugineus]
MRVTDGVSALFVSFFPSASVTRHSQTGCSPATTAAGTVRAASLSITFVAASINAELMLWHVRKRIPERCRDAKLSGTPAGISRRYCETSGSVWVSDG